MKNTNKQRGLTLPELLIWLGVLAGVGSFIVVQGSGILTGTRVEQANQELNGIILAVQSYRNLNGNYDGISIKELDDNGYNINMKISGNNGVNVFNELTSVTPSGGNRVATVAYPTKDDDTCNQLLKRMEQLDSVTPSCGGTGNKRLSVASN